MENKTKCTTYFHIVGKFDSKQIEDLLKIKPFDQIKTKNKHCDKTSFSCCRCDEYDVMLENQMRKTIAPLVDKIEILNKIKSDFEVKFYLEIVPEIYTDEVTPCLAPPLDVMEFCVKTKTEIDIDYYLYSNPCPYCGKFPGEEVEDEA